MLLPLVETMRPVFTRRISREKFLPLRCADDGSLQTDLARHTRGYPTGTRGPLARLLLPRRGRHGCRPREAATFSSETLRLVADLNRLHLGNGRRSPSPRRPARVAGTPCGRLVHEVGPGVGRKGARSQQVDQPPRGGGLVETNLVERLEVAPSVEAAGAGGLRPPRRAAGASAGQLSWKRARPAVSSLR